MFNKTPLFTLLLIGICSAANAAMPTQLPRSFLDEHKGVARDTLAASLRRQGHLCNEVIGAVQKEDYLEVQCTLGTGVVTQYVLRRENGAGYRVRQVD